MDQQQTAQRVLTQFQENPDAWQRVPAVLETSGNLNTKVRIVLSLNLSTWIAR